jgi:hypothetical protein
MARRHDEDDDRPRRRRNEDDDDRPRRRDRDDDEYDRRGRDRDDDDRPNRDDDDRPRRGRSSKDMGFLDRTFADTHIVLLAVFATVLCPVAFFLSVIELILGKNDRAINHANVCLLLSIFAAIMLTYAMFSGGLFG